MDDMIKDYWTQMADEVVNEIQREKNNWVDDMLIQRLKLSGHEFDNRKDLEEFVKAHCMIKVRGDNNQMFVDGKLVAEWRNYNIFEDANMSYLFGFGI